MIEICFENEPKVGVASWWEQRQYRSTCNHILKAWMPFTCAFFGFESNHKLWMTVHPDEHEKWPEVGGIFNGQVGNRPRIDLYDNTERDTKSVRRTFFHEMVHYKQWLYDYNMTCRMEDENQQSYWDQPIEKEAYELADIMDEHYLVYGGIYKHTYQKLLLTESMS